MGQAVILHGIDHKVGTSMVSQSIAEMIAKEKKNLSIILVSLNSKQNIEFVKEDVGSIEDAKILIENRMLKEEDVKRICSQRENLHILGGINGLREDAFFLPETAEYLITTLRNIYNVVVVDAGNDLNNGLSVGAIMSDGIKYLICTQHESILKQFDLYKNLYETMQLEISGMIVNKYLEDDPYDLSYIARRLNLDKSNLTKVNMTTYGRQAEIDACSILGYKEKSYDEDIRVIVNNLFYRDQNDYFIEDKGTKTILSHLFKSKRNN